MWETKKSCVFVWLTHMATVQSASNRFLLPNRNLKEAQSSKVLLWRPLWPSGLKQYEWFKFLLWRGSACERHGSKLGMTGKQQNRVTFLDSAHLCDWTAAGVCRSSLRAQCERSPGASSSAGAVNSRRASTRLDRSQRASGQEVPGCLRWWNMGSQTWHWWAASPPCPQPRRSAGQSGPASSTLFHPVRTQTVH